MSAFSYQHLIGAAIEPYIPDLAKLRMQVFKEFPYLYDGTADYEEEYLQVYANSPRSLVVLAKEGNRIVGATTCIPLADESKAFRKPFQDQNYPINQIFYFGESIILAECRGRGTGKAFFNFREEHARAQIPDLRFTSFCAVNRPADHPLRPKEYRPLDEFWQRMGYQKENSLMVHYPWKDIDQAAETTKSMTFWLKSHA